MAPRTRSRQGSAVKRKSRRISALKSRAKNPKAAARARPKLEMAAQSAHSSTQDLVSTCVESKLEHCMASSCATPAQQSCSKTRLQAQGNAGSAGSGSTKKVRGLTRGVKYAKKLQSGENSHAEIQLEAGRIVGENSQEFVTKLGIVVRNNAPLQVKKWGQIPKESKAKLWDVAQVELKLIDNEVNRIYVMEQMQRQYRNWRSELYRKHYLKYNTDEERLQNIPPYRSEADWQYLVTYFGSDEYKAISERNKKNRAKQDIVHIAGSKSFARMRYENQNKETGAKPSQMEMWQKTHQRKDGSWANQQSSDVWLQMKQYSTQTCEQKTPLTEDEILVRVLGVEKSRYLRRRGVSAEPSNTVVARETEEAIQSYRRVADEARKETEDVKRKLEDMEGTINSRIQAEVQKQMSAFFKRLEMQGTGVQFPLSQPLQLEPSSPSQ
ncbi:uncharacterized protein LOC131149492 isoform X2 [Malania oleifera]|uniref:uncharacterized protein LOC131149492 isoform X2 n=1 Tax=Malania oleifera TaxID=397392 RepID=UPI0025AEBE26|nr:uncharacterized protein LOC131149492 isoform X2 [Malania oleifera]